MVAAAAGLAMIAAGCSDDDSADGDGGGTTTETTVASAEPVDDTTSAEGVVTITMDDYSFVDLPAEVPAGTRFQVANVSSEEIHEVVAVRLPEDEDRPVSELMSMSLEELGPMMGGEPDMVLIAMPDSDETIAPYGDTLTDPGRYLIACFIPVDAPMDHQGPPTPDMAPFHYERGMWGELTVT